MVIHQNPTISLRRSCSRITINVALVLSALSGGTRGTRPTGLCHDNAVVLRPTGPDSRGRLSLRVVPRLMHCGGCSLSAGREAPPYGFCHDNAVVLRTTGPDSRGRLSLRIVPR